MIGGLVLAAGAGTRFGGPKQLAELDGRPLLEHALRAMTASPVGRVVVVLGALVEEVTASVDLHGAEPCTCMSAMVVSPRPANASSRIESARSERLRSLATVKSQAR